MAKSSFVIGSLNFFRRNRCSTRMSTFGGYAFANLRWYRPTACAYCRPRKTSSVSFSRCAAWRQTGMTTVIMMDMMAIATTRAAIA